MEISLSRQILLFNLSMITNGSGLAMYWRIRVLNWMLDLA
jgi:hypothetical protein